MRPLSPSELLDAWERGLSAPPAARALGLLAAAEDGASIDALAGLSVGERDRRLLTLREWTFGSQMASVSVCPACRERLEWSVDAGALGVADAARPIDDLALDSSGYAVRFRLPNTTDLAAAAEAGDVAAARRLILDRCLLDARHDGASIAAADVPSGVLDDVASRMALVDRGADTDVALTCPACGHHWTVLFDIESFFWSELSAWAQRVLKDVHALAGAYGWREADILQMGQWRREYYLALIGA